MDSTKKEKTKQKEDASRGRSTLWRQIDKLPSGIEPPVEYTVVAHSSKGKV